MLAGSDLLLARAERLRQRFELRRAGRLSELDPTRLRMCPRCGPLHSGRSHHPSQGESMTFATRGARPRPGQVAHLAPARNQGDRAQQPEHEYEKRRDSSEQRRAERRRRAASRGFDKRWFRDDTCDGRGLGDDTASAEWKRRVELIAGRLRSSFRSNAHTCARRRLRSDGESGQQQHGHAEEHPMYAVVLVARGSVRLHLEAFRPLLSRAAP